MQPYYYDDRSHPPNSQQPSYPAGGWMDGLAAQQYGMDPRMYASAHAGASTQYPGNPYGTTMSAAYPTSAPHGSYTEPNAPYPAAYSHHQQQQTSWQPTTSSTYDPYSVQHISLNTNPGAAPVFLYPPSHASAPTAHPGSFPTYPSHSTAHPSYPDDTDDPPGRDASGRTRGWSQQFTVQGTPRERIAVACDRCRVRKMKCDGAQPACSNCQRAAHQGVECHYEPEPGRRGPDQAQRVRSPPGQRKPRKAASSRRDREDSPPEASGYRW